MKPLFLSILTLFAFHPMQAQKFEIGLNGGVAYTSGAAFGSEIKDNRMVTEGSGKSYSPAGAVQAMYGYKKWQIGLSVAYREERYAESYVIPWGCFGAERVDVNAKEILIPVSVVAARKFIFHHFEPYCGMSVGYAMRVHRKKIEESYYSVTNQYGWTGSLHIGCAYYFTKKIGLNIEAAGDRMVVKSGSGSDAKTVGLISYPVAVGIRYKL